MKFFKTIFLATAMTSIMGVQSCALLDQLTNQDVNIDGLPSITTNPACSHTATYTPVLKDPNQVFSVGKTVFDVIIEDTACAPVSGLTVEAAPEMDMTTMVHGTPVESVIDNGDGSYRVTAYFLMDSAGGSWTIHFHVNGVHLADHIPVTVGGSMMERGVLKGINDKIMGMMMASSRPYFIFKSNFDAVAGNVDLYLATRADMFIHPPVFSGTTLVNEMMATWSVGTVDLRICTTAGSWSTYLNNNNTPLDTTDDFNEDLYTCGGWTSLTPDPLNPGHYTGSLSMIADTHNPANMMMSAPQFAVSLNVADATNNTSEWKTTSGTAGIGDGSGLTELTHINQ